MHFLAQLSPIFQSLNTYFLCTCWSTADFMTLKSLYSRKEDRKQVSEINVEQLISALKRCFGEHEIESH